MKAILEKIILKSNKSTIQALVRDFSVHRLAYIYPEVIEDSFNVRKGTSDFGIKASEIFEEYKVNHIRLKELDLILMKTKTWAKNCHTLEIKKENIRQYNEALIEWKELHKPMDKFVRLCNKVIKQAG